MQVEQTAGEWITYRAEITRGGKHGVVAYRPKRGAKPAPAPKAPAPPPAHAPPPYASKTSSAPAPAPALPRPSSPTDLRPVLHQGAGMGGLAALQPWVKQVQVALQLPLVDGKMGPGTVGAVKAFQRAHGLDDDGVVGAQTWAALDAARAQQPAA
jgi:lysozyme family protein